MPPIDSRFRQLGTVLMAAACADAVMTTSLIMTLVVMATAVRSRGMAWRRSLPPMPPASLGPLVAIEEQGRRRRLFYYSTAAVTAAPLHALPDPQRRHRRAGPLQAVLESLLPEGYFDRSRGTPPVSDDYLPFTILHFVQNVVHAAASVIATQSMLYAVGLSQRATVGISGAVQWVLKDGLGRIGAIVFGSVLGNRYDADPKRWRMRGDVLYTFGVGTEMITRLCPQYFLLVGTIANTIKSVSYMMRLPTAAAIRRNFSLRENFGDLSAKANAQEVLSMLVGTFAGIGLSYVLGSSVRGMFAFYGLYASLFVWFNYWSLRVLQIRTLNLQRCLIAMRHYWDSGGEEVLSVAAANRAESVLIPSRWAAARRVRFGCRLADAFPTRPALEQAIRRQREWRHDWYCGQQPPSQLSPSAQPEDRYLLATRPDTGTVYLVLHRDAGVLDEVRALMHASYLVRRNWGALPDLSPKRVREAYMAACTHTPLLLQALRSRGWNVDEFVHSGGLGCRSIWGRDLWDADGDRKHRESAEASPGTPVHPELSPPPSTERGLEGPMHAPPAQGDTAAEAEAQTLLPLGVAAMPEMPPMPEVVDLL
ncbi:hypothetical protein CDCA_CDCA09G2578 [Cyanidium caldarium]|uniref:Vitamin B6 photo-protection and homoeostasis-domain-containing protein n=1 Tax=Cyanidium caldarium TaxID=2771 RepID=A0AAV9IXM7_CYACA|nr:hypothetical protein CDCA_CDCA09G2578 [Cyanidium caldarium]